MTYLPTTFKVDDRRLSLPSAPFCDEDLLTLPMDAPLLQLSNTSPFKVSLKGMHDFAYMVSTMILPKKASLSKPRKGG